MVFERGAQLYSVEIERKERENIMYINYMGAPHSPSIADSMEVMSRTVDALIENPNVSRVVFVQQKNYDYPSEQVLLLAEIARLYNFLIKQERVFSAEKLGLFSNLPYAKEDVGYLINLLRADPISCYLEILKKIKESQKHVEEAVTRDVAVVNYLRFLNRIADLMEQTRLIKKVQSNPDSYVIGDRTPYRDIFRPDMMPNFTFTRLVAKLPEDAELVDQYEIGDEEISVTILKKKYDSNHIYHIMPPEYSLSEEQHQLLNLGRNVMVKHEPKAEEFTDPARVREIFFNIARDLLSELAQNKGINLNYRELNKLAGILVRQTIGFGLLEVLLMDDQLQDIFLNSPVAQNPVFVQHAEHGECETNVYPSYEDADSWAAKLRLQSGRALDEANPILDTDLTFGDSRARIAAIQNPLSPSGVAYALRRHRDSPWTLPLFIKNGMINSFTAGLLSFLIDGNRTFLIAGTRSSGKTSFLGSLMLEILPKVRTLVIEDTLELPVNSLKKLGYNIQRMKVKGALADTTTEVEASDGIRASLRLGDSALIVGEVRSTEAKALYEAMRVGALANVVAGTIHGASPYGVFDRLVNDLNVPTTSFKATDLVIVANPIRSPDGLHSKKRILQITEVRKHWNKDPAEEKGFVDLLRYNVEKDELEPTEDLINGNSEVLKDIAGNVKGWAGNWDAIYDNIILRGMVKQEIVNIAEKLEKPELLEAKFNTIANDAFHVISDEVTQEEGLPKSDIVFPKWKEWLMRAAKEF